MSNSYLVSDVAPGRLGHSGHSGHRRHFSLPARMVAEAFGSFMLTLGVLGTLAFSAVNQYTPWLITALVSGLMLAAAVAAVGAVSGGHFNPAVTFGAALAGRTHWRNVLPYILAQIIGAIAAAFVIWAIIPSTFPALIGAESRNALIGSTASGFGTRSPLYLMAQGQTEFSMLHALLAEIIFSAIFVGVVLSLMRRHHRISPGAPLMIGLTWAALYLISWPITGGGLNPARSIASAVFAGNGEIWRQIWLFLLAPLIGAALAALFYRAFQPITAAPDVDAFVGADAFETPHTMTMETSDWVQDGPAQTVDVETIAEQPATEVVVDDGYATVASDADATFGGSGIVRE